MTCRTQAVLETVLLLRVEGELEERQGHRGLDERRVPHEQPCTGHVVDLGHTAVKRLIWPPQMMYMTKKRPPAVESLFQSQLVYSIWTPAWTPSSWHSP